jgi:ATP-dependent Clp protease ATP-binding subunit ClpA
VIKIRINKIKEVIQEQDLDRNRTLKIVQFKYFQIEEIISVIDLLVHSVHQRVAKDKTVMIDIRDQSLLFY